MSREQKRPRTGKGGGASADPAELLPVAAATAVLGAASGAALDGASGASSQGKTLCILSLLEMESSHKGHLQAWAEDTKAFVDQALLQFLNSHKADIGRTFPNRVTLFQPLAIGKSAPGSALSSFREVMNYENLQTSFARNGQYEAAGTVWMLDSASGGDSVMVSQLEHCMRMWSDSAFMMSGKDAAARRFTFEVPLPAQVIDPKVAQAGDDGWGGHGAPVAAARGPCRRDDMVQRNAGSLGGKCHR